MTRAVHEAWKQIAYHIGEEVRAKVNTPEMLGTDDETGYVLMFFNTRNHQGKSTLVSSETDRVQLKRAAGIRSATSRWAEEHDNRTGQQTLTTTQVRAGSR
jgi:hypothetical protein